MPFDFNFVVDNLFECNSVSTQTKTVPLNFKQLEEGPRGPCKEHLTLPDDHTFVELKGTVLGGYHLSG